MLGSLNSSMKDSDATTQNCDFHRTLISMKQQSAFTSQDVPVFNFWSP